MKKQAKHIQIVRSPRRALNSLSDGSSRAILAVLSEFYDNVGITIVDDLADLEALVAMRPDVVFMGVKYVFAERDTDVDDPDMIWIADYLDAHDITYTGSNGPAHELERNKHLAKQRVLAAGLHTSAFYVVSQADRRHIATSEVDFPLFVKPASRGGGRGVDGNSVVHNYDQLNSKVTSLSTEFQADSFIEKYLSGREFSVAVLKDESSDDYSVMPIELIAPQTMYGDRVLSSAVKSADAEEAQVVNDVEIYDGICQLAIDVFHALGAQDYGRIDIRLDAAGVPHFLEANLIPSLTDNYGSFPKACQLNSQLAYAPMILQITQLALARTLANQGLSLSSL